MLEARLQQGSILKKIIEAIKELVTDANFDCNNSGLCLQAMDNAHVALVSLLLRSDGFDPFQCDRNISLGINLNSLSKILKCAGNDDVITIKAEESADVLTLLFESPSNDRLCEYELKLMDIDSEHLGIPDTDYHAVVYMPSMEFQRICRDLSTLSETVMIEASKEGVKFTASGELGSGSITLKQSSSVDSDEQETTTIDLTEPVSLTFSLKYLSNFTKAAPLSSRVILSMANNVPLMVEFRVNEYGYIRYYLAPKINEEE